MKIAAIILSSLTILMALSQMICGLWVQSHGAPADQVSFHIRFGIGTVITAVVTVGVLLFFLFRK